MDIYIYIYMYIYIYIFLFFIGSCESCPILESYQGPFRLQFLPYFGYNSILISGTISSFYFGYNFIIISDTIPSLYVETYLGDHYILISGVNLEPLFIDGLDAVVGNKPQWKPPI